MFIEITSFTNIRFASLATKFLKSICNTINMHSIWPGKTY